LSVGDPRASTNRFAHRYFGRVERSVNHRCGFCSVVTNSGIAAACDSRYVLHIGQAIPALRLRDDVPGCCTKR
jgi:hypothetical protein